jgi:uncharacterized OB-fold protein
MTDAPVIGPYLDAVAERRLVLPYCQSCANFHWYPLPLCPFCQSAEWSWSAIGGEGRLFSWTLVTHAFDRALADKTPYLVALVQPDDAPDIHLVTTVVGCEPRDLSIGMRLVADFAVPIAGEALMPVFRPL